jgi:superfamily II DNA helicase RecQ
MSDVSDESLRETLHKYYGYTAFRGEQLEVIRAALDGRDSAVYWPTGQGKSLCFQLPALVSGQTTLVVSPLVSLMQDQVSNLNSKVGSVLGGDVACFLGSHQADASMERRALNGDFAFVYLTPEKLCSDGFLTFLESAQLDVGLLAVDEAHTVSA